MSNVIVPLDFPYMVFQMIEVFDFSIGYNGKFEIFVKKSLKIGSSKFKTS